MEEIKSELVRTYKEVAKDNPSLATYEEMLSAWWEKGEEAIFSFIMLLLSS